MSNKFAILLVVLIAAAFALDFGLNDGQASFFLAQKYIDFLEWLAVWR